MAIIIHNLVIDMILKVFTNSSGNRGLIPDQVITKT